MPGDTEKDKDENQPRPPNGCLGALAFLMFIAVILLGCFGWLLL
jgi:hypothetical protein